MFKIHSNRRSFNSVLKSSLDRIDLFAPPPKFTIFKQPKFSTTFGILLTLLIAVISLFLFVIQLQQMINQVKPQVVVSDQQTLSTEPILLSPSNFTFAITFPDSISSKQLQPDIHLDLKIMQCHRSRRFNEDGKVNVTSNCSLIPYEKCSLEKHFVQSFQQEYFKNFNLESIYCIKQEYFNETMLTLQGTGQAQDFQFINILVNYCYNNTNRNSCLGLEENKKTLETARYVIYLTDALVKTNQIGRPYQDIINYQLTSFPSLFSKGFQTSFKIQETITDEGIIGTNNQYEMALTQNQIYETTEGLSASYLISNIVNINKSKTLYQRSYIKLQDILSNIGGLWQTLFLLGKILITPLAQQLMNFEISNKIFNFEKQEQNQNQSLDDQSRIIFKSGGSSRIAASRKLDTLKSLTELRIYLKQRKKSLSFNFKEWILMLFGCRKVQQRQLNYALEKIMAKLDVTYIIQKFQEIEKLKKILLTEDQQHLFEYIPQPLIPQEVFGETFREKVNNLEQMKQFQFILQEDKSNLLKLQLAYQSYQYIIKKKQKQPIDQQLLMMLDNEIVELFSKLLKEDLALNQIFEEDPLKKVQISLESPSDLVSQELVHAQRVY